MFPPVINLGSLNGINGFRLDGAAANSRSGWSVSNAGDINGDTIDDLIVGAYQASNAGSQSGSSYVVFGNNATWPMIFPLSSLNGMNRFRLDGVGASDRSGASVSSVGDINGDTIDDLIIGAPFADNGGTDSGSSYVVFGSNTTWPAAFPLSNLNGMNGFRLDAGAADDRLGFSVSNAGDVNGDTIDDLIVGAYSADNVGTNSGSSYVVFGMVQQSPSPSLSLSPSLSPSPSPSPSPSESSSPSSSASSSESLSASAESSSLVFSSSGAPTSSSIASSSGVTSSTGLNSPASPSVSSNVATSDSEGSSFNTVSSSIITTFSAASASIDSSSGSFIETSSLESTNSEILSSSSSSLMTASSEFSSAAKAFNSTEVKLSSQAANTTSVMSTVSSASAPASSNLTSINKIKSAKTKKTQPTQTASLTQSQQTSSTGHVPPKSEDIKQLFFQQGHGHREINLNQERVYVDVAANNPNARLHVRDVADDSASLRTEPLWMGLPMLNAAQIPLAQTGIHLIQQGYNRVIEWFQGKGSDEGIQIKELLPREQVARFLQDYNQISQQLEGIIQQLESDDSSASNMLGWLKDSIVEHRAQGQKLIGQHMVAQESIKAYFENIQAVAKDLTDFVADLAETTNNPVLPYTQSRLAGVNQELTKLAENPVVVAKDQAVLRANVRAQIQANTLQQQQTMNILPQQSTMNMSTQLTADTIGLLV